MHAGWQRQAYTQPTPPLHRQASSQEEEVLHDHGPCTREGPAWQGQGTAISLARTRTAVWRRQGHSAAHLLSGSGFSSGALHLTLTDGWIITGSRAGRDANPAKQ